MPEELVISDASPLIALVDIGELEILRQLYQRVTITDIVRDEIHAELPEWIEVSTEYDPKQVQILQLELDPGEASASGTKYLTLFAASFGGILRCSSVR